MELPKSLEKVSKILSRLPGLGPRQALRLSFYLLRQDKNYQKDFLESFNNFFTKIKLCQECSFPFETMNDNETLCSICRDKKRDHTLLCIVEKETDLLTIEKTNKYQGLYHILGRLINDVNSENSKIILLKLIKRIKENKPKIKEVILALSPTSEGNLTTYYLEKSIKKIDLGIKITKLGRGLPQGGEVEFADAETLVNALEGRK